MTFWSKTGFLTSQRQIGVSSWSMAFLINQVSKLLLLYFPWDNSNHFCWISEINVFGKALFLTLIARRSRFFAGARYLKRGVNSKGHVANDVESEQIVIDGTVTGLLLNKSKWTSFVQHRGSIPLFWTQDVSASMGGVKPPIECTTKRLIGDDGTLLIFLLLFFRSTKIRSLLLSGGPSLWFSVQAIRPPNHRFELGQGLALRFFPLFHPFPQHKSKPCLYFLFL